MSKLLLVFSLFSSITFASSLVGTWEMVKCSNAEGQQTIDQLKAAGGYIETVLGDDSSIKIAVVMPNDSQVLAAGTYSFDEATSIITFKNIENTSAQKVDFLSDYEMRFTDTEKTSETCNFIRM